MSRSVTPSKYFSQKQYCKIIPNQEINYIKEQFGAHDIEESAYFSKYLTTTSFLHMQNPFDHSNGISLIFLLFYKSTIHPEFLLNKK